MGVAEGSHGSEDNYDLPSSYSSLSTTVEKIFKMRPQLYKGPGKGSDSTRGPAFHDQHLSQALLLKKTVFCPNLVDQLGGVAETALREAHLPNAIRAGWKPGSMLNSEIFGLVVKELAAEIDVVLAYQNNVFSHIVSIASVLEFPSSSWRVQFLELSTTDSIHLDGKAKEGRKSKYALADSILTINPDLHEESIPSASKTLEEMKTVVKYFNRIIPFEFKSLTSGSYGTILGILGHTLLEDFPWQSCLGPYCAYEHGPKLGHRPVTGDPLGFDAAAMDVQFDMSVWTGSHREEFDRMRDKEKVKHAMHGRNMLQQIWAEMVKCDATYAVLNAGNYELLFLRHRETQTLYISDVIEPHSTGDEATGRPGYYQVHIGLYIAAIRDARSRAMQLEDFGGQQDMLPDTWTRPYDCGSGRYKPAKIPKPAFHDVISKYPELCLGLVKSDSTKHMFITHKPYRRSLCPIGPQGTFFFLEVKELISPTEYVGTITAQGHTFTSFPIVIKVANERRGTSNLYTEYKTHLKLLAKSMHGTRIQRSYGFFRAERGIGSEENFNSVLLLEYAGKQVPELSYLTPFQKLTIERTLSMVHQQGLVHGALKRHKIHLDSTQEGRKGRGCVKVWLTDLSQVRQAEQDENGEDEMLEERKKLRRWLKYPKKDNPSPSHPVELGPIPFPFDDAKATFCRITAWMVCLSWLGTVHCSLKDDVIGDTWLVAKFVDEEHVAEFITGWYSSSRPAEFYNINCADTSFNQESQASSQAYSQASSQAYSQASSQAYSQALSPSPGLGVDESPVWFDYDS